MNPFFTCFCLYPVLGYDVALGLTSFPYPRQRSSGSKRVRERQATFHGINAPATRSVGAYYPHFPRLRPSFPLAPNRRRSTNGRLRNTTAPPCAKPAEEYCSRVLRNTFASPAPIRRRSTRSQAEPISPCVITKIAPLSPY